MPLRLLLALLALASATPKAEIQDLSVKLAGDGVQVSFTLENAFGTEIAERIASGLATGFTYEFELQRIRRSWWDHTLEEAELEVLVMYNAMSDEYLVNYKLEGKLIESRLARDAAELERAMTHFEGLSLFPLDALPADERLSVRVRAHLGSRTVMKFIPTRISTDWAHSERFELPDTR